MKGIHCRMTEAVLNSTGESEMCVHFPFSNHEIINNASIFKPKKCP